MTYFRMGCIGSLCNLTAFISLVDAESEEEEEELLNFEQEMESLLMDDTESGGCFKYYVSIDPC